MGLGAAMVHQVADLDLAGDGDEIRDQAVKTRPAGRTGDQAQDDRAGFVTKRLVQLDRVDTVGEEGWKSGSPKSVTPMISFSSAGPFLFKR